MKSNPSSGHADYDVGYGKPPRHSRFQAGRSGNPKGRPKGSRNLASELERELAVRVTIVENGHQRTITKRQAAVKQLVNKAASGDHRSLQLMMQLNQVNEVEEATQHTPFSHEADEQVKRDLLRRLQQSVPGADHGKS